MDLKNILKKIKLHESTISMLFGALLIIISGVLVINFFAQNDDRTIPVIDTDQGFGSLPTTHIVTEGEDLWSISEKYYGTGYNWNDIYKVNSLEDPGDIRVGDVLTIPDVEPWKLVSTSITPAQTKVPTKEPTAKPTSTPTIKPVPQIIEDRENMMDENEIYVVQDGDSLWKIAENRFRSGYNWVDIANANDLRDPGLITVGQELIIPDVEARRITVSEPIRVSETNPITGTSYLIQKGDSLWTIAVRAYGDGYKWVEIAKENNIDNPNLIFTGNTLTLSR